MSTCPRCGGAMLRFYAHTTEGRDDDPSCLNCGFVDVDIPACIREEYELRLGADRIGRREPQTKGHRAQTMAERNEEARKYNQRRRMRPAMKGGVQL